jgi:hypothetical protein
MKLLPIENITYQTKLKEEDIIHRLVENIEPKKMFRFGSGSTKPYEGEIDENTFSIRRIIRNKNSFLPQIKGKIEKEYYSTIISVKMRLRLSVIIFLCFWCGCVGFICMLIIFIILTKSSESSGFPVGAIIPFGMLFFAYGLTMVSFKAESNKSKKYLKELFEADIIEE